MGQEQGYMGSVSGTTTPGEERVPCPSLLFALTQKTKSGIFTWVPVNLRFHGGIQELLARKGEVSISAPNQSSCASVWA